MSLPSVDGLTEPEVRDRVAAGRVNDVPVGPSRTIAEIVRDNVFTRFNALLGSLLVVILIVGPYQDALFGFVLIANTLIGIVQELRAKRTLDRLAVLTSPKARVVRDGTERSVPLSEVVEDDILALQPGDQVVVDAQVLETKGLEIDESLLSGESEPAEKRRGDEVLSGSFVAAGSGRCRATRVGGAAYAVQLALEARRFALTRSELRSGIEKILRIVTWLIVPTAVLLVFSQLRSNASIRDALRGSVAGTVAMVPEGLVLLTSVAFAVGVVRLGRRNVLVKELPAVEVLARVDVLCIDKTGTLTEGRLDVEEIEAFEPGQPLEEALGALASSDPHPNATLLGHRAAIRPHRRLGGGRGGPVLLGSEVECRLIRRSRNVGVGSPRRAASTSRGGSPVWPCGGADGNRTTGGAPVADRPPAGGPTDARGPRPRGYRRPR